jgi:TonB family protein
MRTGSFAIACLSGVLLATPALAAANQSAALKGNPGEWFGPDAYPPAAIRAGEQGRVVTVLSVNASGAVDHCTVKVSSGSTALDDATCTIAMKHAFEPARDEQGKPIASLYTLPVRWALPEDSASRDIGYEDGQVAFSGSGAAATCTLTIEGRVSPEPAKTCQDFAAEARGRGIATGAPFMIAIPAAMHTQLPDAQ